MCRTADFDHFLFKSLAVEARCAALLDLVVALKLEMTNKFKQEKLRLPSAMRRMPLKQFIKDYGESAADLLAAGHLAPTNEEANMDPQTVVKAVKRDVGGQAFHVQFQVAPM
jgi:hypothetical protein